MSAKDTTSAPEKKKKESILDLTRLVDLILNSITLIVLQNMCICLF